MSDPRAQNLAKILVGYSTKVKEGDVVAIDGESAAEPLLLAVYEEVLKAGGNPILNAALDGQIAAYFKHASDAQLEWVSPFAEWMVDNADVRIAIGASTNTARALRRSPPERQTLRQSATGELMARAMKRSAEGDFRWCYTLYPTSAYASEAEMSLADYEDFYFGACLADDSDPLTAWKRGLGGDAGASRSGSRATRRSTSPRPGPTSGSASPAASSSPATASTTCPTASSSPARSRTRSRARSASTCRP